MGYRKSIKSEGVTEMIILHSFVNFFILVFKGISLLLNGLFSVIKTIVKLPLTIVSYVFKGLGTIFKPIGDFVNIESNIVYRAIRRVFITIYKAFAYVLNAIWRLLVRLITFVLRYTLKGFFMIVAFVLRNIFSIIRYDMNGIFMILKLMFIIFDFFFGKAFRTIAYAIEGFLDVTSVPYRIAKLVIEGIVEVAIFIFKIFVYIGKGFLVIFNVLAFIPKSIGRAFKSLFDGPIHDLIDYNSKTIRIVKSRIKDWPKNVKQYFVDKYNDSTFVKHRRNTKDMNRQVLLIDFNSLDAKRSEKKIVWQYLAKDENGKMVRGIFEAYSKLDVHSFLMSEGYEVYEINTSKTIGFFYGGQSRNNHRVKMKKMIFFLTQLSTYIRAGIPLTDSVRILARQEKDKSMQRLYQSIIYELTMGENFSMALEKQGEAFPKLLVNMLKTSEMTGELAETLDDMSEYYGTMHKLKKQTMTSMMYPMVVFFFVIVVIVFIMIYVIPQFIEIYKDSEATLPQITVITIAISAFLKKYIIFVMAGVAAFIFMLFQLFKRVKFFRTMVQYIVMHIPVIKNVIIYNEITTFTKTFSALLQHNVFITDSMEILSKVTSNEIYKMIVFDAVSNIARGESISSSFKNHWAIPSLAYEMMLTGERTGQLPLMMGKVAGYYQEEQKNLVNQIKTLIEPLVIVFLAVAVGVILLAVVVPMFSLYSDLSSGV